VIMSAEELTADAAGRRADEVAAAAQLACVLEVTAPKPGNVSPGLPFADSQYEDFVASAVAIGPVLAAAGTRRLGETIRLAVAATARWTRSNTNLGIVLLFAPLSRAALLEKGVVRGFQKAHELRLLRSALAEVLAETTVEDARDVYAAIRQAAPGGLGRVGDQDVTNEPTLTLRDVMKLAADRDGIAREYVTDFQTTFDVAAPALLRARCDRLTWSDAIVETFLQLLASTADTHIVRRAGPDAAGDVTSRARTVLDAGGVRSDAGRRAILEMDRALRDDRHLLNPGTTADLTAAALFVALLGGAWHPAHGGVDAAEG